jgi:hypothetical protein
MRLDHEWPTYDPYVRRNRSWVSAHDLFHNHLRDKTLTLVGDSINNLWFHAILCEAARHGLTIRPPAHIVATNTTILQMGWGKPSRADTEAYLAASDVLVVNYGLHYHNEAEYAVDMHGVLADLGEFNKRPGKQALFRETSAQAFAKTGAYAGVTTMGCAPTPLAATHDNLVYRQNEFIRRAAPTYGVPVLPFYEETLPRWNMREEKFCEAEARRERPEAECTDCTHLCYTPTFWAERVHELALRLE